MAFRKVTDNGETIKKFAEIAVRDVPSMELFCQWYRGARFPIGCLREYVPEYFDMIHEYIRMRGFIKEVPYELVKNVSTN
jgi:hypothetical protein